MNLNKDAYGQEIWAFLKGEKAYEIIERSDGYVDLSGGPENYFAGFRDWPEIEKEAIKMAKGKVLDIGAGAGRNSLYLQKKGFKITAIDNSPLAIKVCKKRGVKDAKVLPIEKISIFKKNTFDTVLMFGNNFGLFSDYKKAKRLLKILYKITKKDALILTESNDPYKTKDPLLLSYHKLNKKKGRMPGQIKIRVRFKSYIGSWFDYLLVSKEEMNDILKGTGWRVKKFIDSDKTIYMAILEKG